MVMYGNKRSRTALAALMCAAVLFGTTSCSSKGTASGSSSSGKEDITKPTEITGIFDGFGSINSDATGLPQFLAEFKKDTGITLKVTIPNHNEYIQKVQMSFASGEIPDIVGLGATDLVNFANNGALYDVSGLISKSPVFQNILKNETSKSSFDSLKVKGKYYGLPSANGSGTVTYIRKDLLDKAGLKMPTTYDEFINVLKAFAKMKTSDGKSIIPYTAPGLDPENCSYLPEFYSATTGRFETENGKWVDGFTTKTMETTLTNLQNAYKDGLLDKEIVTNKTSTCRDKWNSGQVGVFTYWAGQWAVAMHDTIKNSTPTAEVAVMPALKGMKYYVQPSSAYAITSKCSNPAGVFKYFFEFAEDGKDGTMLFAHGVKDVQYSVDSSGVYHNLPNPASPGSSFTNAVIEIGHSVQPSFKDPFIIDERIAESNKILAQSQTAYPLRPASDSYSKNGGTLQTLRSQLTAKVVIEGLPVASAISQYKVQADSMVTQILSEFNQSSK